MKKTLAMLLLMALFFSGVLAVAEQEWISDDNKAFFADLLTDLMRAYETPSKDDDTRIDTDLAQIRLVSESDWEIASAIAEHWRDVYLDDDYPLFVYKEGEQLASALKETSLRDSERHAFVLLGYELKNGEMQPELVGRCDAAAAAARSFPSAIIVCSGGATGDNNPKLHTEAGMMRDYLIRKCGIDAARIHIDEDAMTTLQNAKNTMEMLKQQDIKTITIVTSTYHQRWGQAIYNAAAALYRKYFDYSVEIVGNYCFDIEPAHDVYRYDDRIAINQIAHLLGVPLEMSM